MKTSELLYLFAKANKKCGYLDYAKDLEEAALVHEAEEIVVESGESNQSGSA